MFLISGGEPARDRFSTSYYHNSGSNHRLSMESDQDVSAGQASQRQSLYQPLRLNDFRLSEISPSRNAEQRELHCHLKVWNLDSPPKYEALSYAWGNNTRPREILLNGEVFPVTSNLYTALRRLQSRDNGRTPLWVDQICINAGDNSEKYQQIRHMSRIYRKASNVIVWLGDVQGTDGDELTLKRILQSSADTRAFYTLLYEQGYSRIWGALEHVYSNSWFSRLWTYQEIALARDVRLLFNGFETTLKQLKTIHSRMEALAESYASVGLDIIQERVDEEFNVVAEEVNQRRQGADHDSSIHTSRLVLGTISEQPSGSYRVYIPTGIKEVALYDLYDHLPWLFPSSTILCQATRGPSRHCCRDASILLGGCFSEKWSNISRDRVFGLLGLSQNPLIDETLASYYRTGSQEFWPRLTVNLVRNGFALDILSFRPREVHVESVGLPSWVPDWTELDTKSQSFLNKLLRPHEDTGCSLRPRRSRPFVKQHGLSLLLKGYILDECYATLSPAEEDLPVVWLERCGWRDKENDVPDQVWRTLLYGIESRNPLPFHYGTLVSEALRAAPQLEFVETRKTAGETGVFSRTVIDIGALKKQDFVERSIRDIARSIESTITSFRLFLTKTGYLGVSPKAIRRGDLICQLDGAHAPFILRKGCNRRTGNISYLVVGTAYVYGLSQRTSEENDRRPTQTFVLEGEVGDQWQESPPPSYEEALMAKELEQNQPRSAHTIDVQPDRSSAAYDDDEEENVDEGPAFDTLQWLLVVVMLDCLDIIIRLVLWSGIAYPLLGNDVLRLIWRYPCGCTYYSDFSADHVETAKSVCQDLRNSKCHCLLLGLAQGVDILELDHKSPRIMMKYLLTLLFQTIRIRRMMGESDHVNNRTHSAGDEDKPANDSDQSGRESSPGSETSCRSSSEDGNHFPYDYSGTDQRRSGLDLSRPPVYEPSQPKWVIVCKNLCKRAWKPSHISLKRLSHDRQLVEALDRCWQGANGLFRGGFGWIRVNRPLVRRVNIVTDDYEDGQEVAHPLAQWGPSPSEHDAMNWDPIPSPERPPDADSWELHLDYLINHKSKAFPGNGKALICWVKVCIKASLNRLLFTVLVRCAGAMMRLGVFKKNSTADEMADLERQVGLDEVVVEPGSGHTQTMSCRIINGIPKRQNIKLRAKHDACSFGWGILIGTHVRPPPFMEMLGFVVLSFFALGTLITCFVLVPTAGWDVFSFVGVPALAVAVVTLIYTRLAAPI
ncbi:heterokaryon incompatibility protein-domain-containing protein [Hypoxylon sp. NC0597]|nr:heterokaryon incompatibility protein-domain-containing protein [Hypoxylon sp. NC0597]